jgi:hypothetical protein
MLRGRADVQPVLLDSYDDRIHRALIAAGNHAGASQVGAPKSLAVDMGAVTR